jgi:hypothetical protein
VASDLVFRIVPTSAPETRYVPLPRACTMAVTSAVDW